MVEWTSLNKGERVVVREYKDMCDEYGSDSEGFIRPRYHASCFNPNMKPWCGEVGTVDSDPVDSRIMVLFDDESLNNFRWNFFDWMLELSDDNHESVDLPDVASLYCV